MKYTFFLYFDIILFYLNWIFFNYSSILRTNIWLKNTVDTNTMLSPSHFNATGCRLWSTGSDRSQSSVLNGIEEPNEIAVVQISQTEYIMKFYDDMFDQIPRKRILWPRNQRETHCLHRWPRIWNSRTSATSRHQNTRELPLKQKQNLHQVGDPIKRHTDLFKYGYIILMYNSPFSLERTVCDRN